MNAAHDLLQSILDFGWPLFAYAIFAPIPTYIFPSGRPREEKTTRLLFVGAILATIEAFFFIGTESSDALQVALLYPAWGAYVLILLIVAAGVGGKWAIARTRENQMTISISRDTAPLTSVVSSRNKLYVVGGAVWLAASTFAVLWLAKIAHTQ